MIDKLFLPAGETDDFLHVFAVSSSSSLASSACIIVYTGGQIYTFMLYTGIDLPARTASSSLCSFAIALRVSFEDAPVISR